MARTLLTVVLVVGVASMCFAAEEKKEDKAPKPNASSTVKAAPRYNPVAERGKFFRAAGRDSEMDSKEFAANQGKTGAFVRKTDTWAGISKYDKNKNGMIDWFEADAYRRSADIKSKTVTVTTIDGAPIAEPARDAGRGRDQSGRGQSRRGRGGFQPSADAIKQYDKDGDGKLGEAERGAYFEARREEFRKREVERYDTNKDGTVDDKEREAAREARRKQQAEERTKRHFERFDADKDGKLNDEEKAGLEKHEAEDKAREERDQARRKEFMAQYDKNKNGRIDEDEQTAVREGMRKRMEERRAEMTKQFDKDGDGKLNEEERGAMMRSFRDRRGGGRGGPGGPGGGRGGPGGGRGGPGGRRPGGGRPGGGRPGGDRPAGNRGPDA